MNNEKDLISWIQSTQEGAIELLEQLVSINTYTTNVAGVNKAQDVIANFLLSLGMQVQRVPVAARGDVLIANTPAAGEKSIVLVGHTDTVHPPDSPFQNFSRTKDRAFGPGVLDMKGGLVTFLWSLRALAEHKLLAAIPVSVFINSDEEIGCPDSHRLIEEAGRKSRAALVFEWGRTADGIILRRKGVGQFSISVRGKASHAGNAHREGANAILQLAHTITRLSTLTDYSRGVTVNVGLVQGGSASNTVPELASAALDLRVEKAEDFKRLSTAIMEIAADIVVPGTSVQIKADSFMPPMADSPESLALFESFRKFAAPAGLSYDQIPGILGGGSDANRTAYQGCPSIDGLGPFGEGAHSDKEYILLDSLPKKMINVALWLNAQREN
ncbi:MAG: M20 family metallopeptidase [Deltaproteobacteria bacterium]|nr:M20 family metallopeptidase [Deltaproteobacteria bacterium]